MKKIIAFFLVFLFTICGSQSVFSQNSDESALSISNVVVVSDKEIDVLFSKPIVISTLRVILENQSTRDIIPVKSYQESSNNATARIELTSELMALTSYKMTVSTATSTTGETIVAGVNAIREFTTPETMEALRQNETLSAPANTSAATATESVASEPEGNKQTGTGVFSGNQENTNNNEIKSNSLPETGMGMYLVFCFLAILISLFAMKKAKRV